MRTGRPVGPVLRMMSDLAVNYLPVAMSFTAPDQAEKPVKVVLTGPGGGTWNLNCTSDEGPVEPDTMIVADVVDFCRVIANRVTPDELIHHVKGDRELVDALLAAARTLSV